MRRAKITSFINYKGGVGKTTTTFHVGCSLAQHHQKKVLLVDIDPQTNLTFLCTSIDDWEKHKQRFGTIATLYKQHLNRKAVDTKRVVLRGPVGRYIKKAISGLDIIPCDIELLGEDLAGTGAVSGTFPSFEALKKNAAVYLRDHRFLVQALKIVESEYDQILVDCPPNLYLMTQAALVASDSYVVTAVPDHLSTIGLAILRNKVSEIGKRISAARTFAGEKSESQPVAKFGGVIFVKVRIGGSIIANMHRARMSQIEKALGSGTCFRHHTTELIGYGEASENFLPVWMDASPNARRAAAKFEYQKITDELIVRV